jgi:DDE family transposase
MRVADSGENRAAFGGQKAGAGRGDSGYPQVRVVAMMALRSHVLSAFRFADYHTGETTLARDIWNEVPEESLVIVDRNFLVKKDLIHLETSGNRHWLSRTKVNTKWAIQEKLGARTTTSSTGTSTKQDCLGPGRCARSITKRGAFRAQRS